MIRRFLVIGLMLWLGCPLIWAQDALGIAVSPLKIQYNAPPGTLEQHQVTLRNTGSHTIELNATFNDWFRDSAGDIQSFPSGQLENSCSQWMQILPQTAFTVNPGEQKELTLLLTVPDSAQARVRNSMLYLTQVNPNAAGVDKQGIQIKMAVRVGIQLYHTPSTLSKKQIDIIDFKTRFIPKEAKGSAHLQLMVKNTGDLVADGSIEPRLLNMQTGATILLSSINFYTLPGATRFIQIPLPDKLVSGRYSATAMVDYGTEQDLKIGTFEFNYPIIK